MKDFKGVIFLLGAYFLQCQAGKLLDLDTDFDSKFSECEYPENPEPYISHKLDIPKNLWSGDEGSGFELGFNGTKDMWFLYVNYINNENIAEYPKASEYFRDFNLTPFHKASGVWISIPGGKSPIFDMPFQKIELPRNHHQVYTMVMHYFINDRNSKIRITSSNETISRKKGEASVWKQYVTEVGPGTELILEVSEGKDDDGNKPFILLDKVLLYKCPVLPETLPPESTRPTVPTTTRIPAVTNTTKKPDSEGPDGSTPQPGDETSMTTIRPRPSPPAGGSGNGRVETSKVVLLLVSLLTAKTFILQWN